MKKEAIINNKNTKLDNFLDSSINMKEYMSNRYNTSMSSNSRYYNELEQWSSVFSDISPDYKGKLPMRPIIELVNMDIFEVIDDLKDKFVWKTDDWQFWLGEDGEEVESEELLMFWMGRSEEEDGDEERTILVSCPEDQTMERM